VTVRKISAKDKTTDTVMASNRIGVVWLLIVSATTHLCLWTASSKRRLFKALHQQQTRLPDEELPHSINMVSI